MANIPFLTPDDLMILRSVVERERKLLRNVPNRPGIQEPIAQASATYMVKVPHGGIFPGAILRCPVYQAILEDGAITTRYIGMTVDVYNPSSDHIASVAPDEPFIVVTKDKFGVWVPCSAGGSATSLISVYDDGELIGTRRNVNFISTEIIASITDDEENDRVNVQFDIGGTGTGTEQGTQIIVQKDGVIIGLEAYLNFITGANTTLTVTDNPGSNRIDVTIAAVIPGATITVEELDGVPSITDVNTLIASQATGIGVQAGGANEAIVYGIAASISQQGMVTTSLQEWTGSKSTVGYLKSWHYVGLNQWSVSLEPYLDSEPSPNIIGYPRVVLENGGNLCTLSYYNLDRAGISSAYDGGNSFIDFDLRRAAPFVGGHAGVAMWTVRTSPGVYVQSRFGVVDTDGTQKVGEWATTGGMVFCGGLYESGTLSVNLATEVTGTLDVDNGGTGLNTLTEFAILAGGTTTTGALQQVPIGTAGQVLISGGVGALPSWLDTTGTGDAVLQNGPVMTDMILNQSADGTDALSGSRFTDSSPTGNYINFKTQAGASAFVVDVTGTITVGTIEGGGW